jgi:hypothetical protein
MASLDCGIPALDVSDSELRHHMKDYRDLIAGADSFKNDPDGYEWLASIAYEVSAHILDGLKGTHENVSTVLSWVCDRQCEVVRILEEQSNALDLAPLIGNLVGQMKEMMNRAGISWGEAQADPVSVVVSAS